MKDLTARPSAGEERILALDVVRGFALFGVLAVNVLFFSGPLMAAGGDFRLFWNGPLDRVAEVAIVTLFGGKCVTIFATLFGIGFGIQVDRIASGGGSAARVYLRRLAFLMVVGLVHGLLIWAGDILFVYALCGLGLLLFRGREPRTILRWAIVLLMPAPVLVLVATVVGVQPPFEPSPAKSIAEAVAAYGHGSWIELERVRLREWTIVQSPEAWVTYLPSFLFGLWLWRSGFVRSLVSRRATLRRVCAWGIPLGVAASGSWAVRTQVLPPVRSDWIAVAETCATTIGVPLQAAGYAAGVALFAQSGARPRLCRWLAATGRLALTNYLLQSVVCTLIFYSYGLGLFGRVGPAAGLVLAAAFFALQMPSSAWWLQRYRFGPVEWMWRAVTYGHLAAMRRLDGNVGGQSRER